MLKKEDKLDFEELLKECIRNGKITKKELEKIIKYILVANDYYKKEYDNFKPYINHMLVEINDAIKFDNILNEYVLLIFIVRLINYIACSYDIINHSLMETIQKKSSDDYLSRLWFVEHKNQYFNLIENYRINEINNYFFMRKYEEYNVGLISDNEYLDDKDIYNAKSQKIINLTNEDKENIIEYFSDIHLRISQIKRLFNVWLEPLVYLDFDDKFRISDFIRLLNNVNSNFDSEKEYAIYSFDYKNDYNTTVRYGQQPHKFIISVDDNDIKNYISDNIDKIVDYMECMGIDNPKFI